MSVMDLMLFLFGAKRSEARQRPTAPRVLYVPDASDPARKDGGRRRVPPLTRAEIEDSVGEAGRS